MDLDKFEDYSSKIKALLAVFLNLQLSAVDDHISYGLFLVAYEIREEFEAVEALIKTSTTDNRILS